VRVEVGYQEFTCERARFYEATFRGLKSAAPPALTEETLYREQIEESLEVRLGKELGPSWRVQE